MRISKIILDIVLIGILIVVFRNFAQPKLPELISFFTPPCTQPIKYHIGTIDKQFNLPKSDFQIMINKSASAWNKVQGKNLLVEDPAGNLVINLKYDERQKFTSQINQIKDQLNSQNTNLNNKEALYKQMVIDFDLKISSLNNEIKDWNNKGGAPPEEYGKLIQRQKDLQTMADQINSLAKELNKSAVNYNLQVNTLNQKIESFDEALIQKPEQGLYDSKIPSIDIYFYTNNSELIHTVEHELGHALGLEHLTNPKSIMFPYSTLITSLSPDDINAINQICSQTQMDIIKKRFNDIMNKVRAGDANYYLKSSKLLLV